MLSLRRKSSGSLASVGKGRRVWAVGDIHGCADLLRALVEQILLVEPTFRSTRIVFLGDYVDRGPASREVLDFLIGLSSVEGIEPSFIRGNHDFMMQEFLRAPEVGPAWLAMGAAATLESYGVAAPAPANSPDALRTTQTALMASVPEAHRVFLERLEPSVVEGDYFFTHAGIKPGKPIARQKPADLMWIRSEFLRDKRRSEKTIVHGHTVSSSPHSDHRRVGVDTGAYASGVLTAVRLDEETRTFMQVKRVGPGGIMPFWNVELDACPSGGEDVDVT